VKVQRGLPHVEIDSTLKEKIKVAMVKRYNVDQKALDLSQFHRDSGKRMVIMCIEHSFTLHML
jgi:nuclear RNA export factor